MNSNVEDAEESTEFNEINDDKSENGEKWWSMITMEPIWFGTVASLSMGLISFQNMFLERTCSVDLGHSPEVCFHSNDTIKKKIEIESQQIITALSIVSNFIGNFLACLVLLFLGSWSIFSGKRKFVILLPIIGMMITSISLLILQAFPNVSSIWAIYFEVLPLSISGSNALLIMTTFTHLNDICYKTGRRTSTVVGLNNAAISASTIIGSLLAPILLKYLKFAGVFTISAILQLSSFLYGLYKIEDICVADEIPGIFSLKSPWQALKCLIKKRKGHKRRNVILMVFVPCTTSITFAIEMILLYLYMRHKFQWTEVEYGLFTAYRAIIQFSGSIFIVKILKHAMKLQYKTIGIIGSVSQFLSTSMFILSTESWMIFLAPLFGIVSRGVSIVDMDVLNMQTIASEQGKLKSITAVFDKIVGMCVIPASYYIYSVSVEWMPNLFLFTSLIAATIQFFSYYYISL